jgi:outer membrane protein TolC
MNRSQPQPTADIRRQFRAVAAVAVQGILIVGFFTIPASAQSPTPAVNIGDRPSSVVASFAPFARAGSNETPLAAQEPSTNAQPRMLTACPDCRSVLDGPVLSIDKGAARLADAEPDALDRPLPINLATALRLAGARPVIIAAAEASVQVAEAELSKANVLWLPSFNLGAGYYRHDGATQGQSGNFYDNSKDQFFAGAGVTARVSMADALYAPLAARQVLRSREIDTKTAQNDSMLAAAVAYFDVQQARGRLAAIRNVVDKSLALGKAIDAQRLGIAKPTDLHRGRALLATFEDEASTAKEQWGLASAGLTRVLRLDPVAIVVPLESPNLRVTLISPQIAVDALIPIGLTGRPELASQQALVQAALVKIRQESMRPLVPSVILEGSPGSAGPGSYLMTGIFSSTVNGVTNPSLGRADISVGLVWELQNLGFGNRALIRERRSEQEQLLVTLYHIQDTVAAEIAAAHVQVYSANARVASAEKGLLEATLAYEGSLVEMGKVEKSGELTVFVRRVFEVIDALRSLSKAYDNYFAGINDYNRAQFRLYRALGCPAEILSCERSPEPILPVDTTRPSQMAPVCAPDPCPRHR